MEGLSQETENYSLLKEKTEKCILCGSETNVSVDQYIGSRKHYIAGAGQLCEKCFNNLYRNKEKEAGFEADINEQYFYDQIQKYKNTVSYKNKYGYELFRRLIDVVFCLVAIIPAIVLIAIFAVAIVIESPGNPIFSQTRVGKNGKFIKIHKLRSMRLDAEANGQKWADKEDPRITKVGKVIRKYRIDELPQLLDVFLGRMSLIGPRPEVPVLTKRFNIENPGFVTRLMVTPGLSGWAQVHGGYEITPKEKWKLDNKYIEERGFKMYFKIFYLTVKTVLTGDGAR
ncbi:sugar transferase [Thomasclavelia sp.]|uniref:sugar transferase n=1 Tax=Thomasclavelia sp. TaxID=3025757 RepID=UPI0025D4093A|nr:sugar transferase [Thomasclavelia sp.]